MFWGWGSFTEAGSVAIWALRAREKPVILYISPTKYLQPCGPILAEWTVWAEDVEPVPEPLVADRRLPTSDPSRQSPIENPQLSINSWPIFPNLNVREPFCPGSRFRPDDT